MRQEVVKFASIMEEKLAQNDHKPSWKNDNVFSLYGRIEDELEELSAAMGSGESPEAIARECADIANFCMMIADIYTDNFKV